MHMFPGDSTDPDPGDFGDKLFDPEAFKKITGAFGVTGGSERPPQATEMPTDTTCTLGPHCAYTTSCEHNIRRVGVMCHAFRL